jgi:ribose 5-phosphate isomerase A
MDSEALKRVAAERAVALVASGMALGLGTGSTAHFVVQGIGRRLQEGSLRDVVGVPTSDRTEEEARSLGIPLTTLNDLAPRRLDMAIDGADEVTPQLDLIKGLGGALLREKVVVASSQRFIVVVDESKLVSRLGTRSPLPVEVLRFGWRTHLAYLEQLGARPELRLARGASEPFVTDEGHYVLDCRFDGIDDPADLDRRIRSRAGVIETGLFVGSATEVVVAGADGVRVVVRGETSEEHARSEARSAARSAAKGSSK